MKIFAHRGWSAGLGENTMPALRKAVGIGTDGVEFDVRLSVDGQTVVLSHDLVDDNLKPTLEEALRFIKPTGLEVLIELKEYSDEFYASVIEHIYRHDLSGRTTVFAFLKEAKQFPWLDRKDIKLGIIAPYPRDIKKYIEAYKPDMVLLGWGNKKERLQFKLVWNVFSLVRTFAKYPSVKFVIGVAYNEKDAGWLSRQSGLYGITADLPL